MTLERLGEIETVALRARDYPGKAMNVVAVPAVEMLALCAVVRAADELLKGRSGNWPEHSMDEAFSGLYAALEAI